MKGAVSTRKTSAAAQRAAPASRCPAPWSGDDQQDDAGDDEHRRSREIAQRQDRAEEEIVQALLALFEAEQKAPTAIRERGREHVGRIARQGNPPE